MKDEEESIDFDIWLYPEQLGIDRVINLFRDEGEIEINEYRLPKNWRKIVKDGEQSIHDIMKEINGV